MKYFPETIYKLFFSFKISNSRCEAPKRITKEDVRKKALPPHYNSITRNFYNQEEAKKSIVLFCYLFAGLRNKFANSYKLDIGLHLASAGTSYKGIDILANTGLIVSSKTVLRYK